MATREEILAKTRALAKAAQEAPATTHKRVQEVPPHVQDMETRARASSDALTCAEVAHDGAVGAYWRSCYQNSIEPNPKAAKERPVLTQYGYGTYNSTDPDSPALSEEERKNAKVKQSNRDRLAANLALAFGWDESDLELCVALFALPRTKAELQALYRRLAEGESLDALADKPDQTGYLEYTPHVATKAPAYTPEPEAAKALATAKAKRATAKK